jgi:hypothetical protein
VDPTRLELVASAMRRRHEGLLEVSGACKTAAKHRFSALALFSRFQNIFSGCCTVAAQWLLLA